MNEYLLFLFEPGVRLLPDERDITRDNGGFVCQIRILPSGSFKYESADRDITIDGFPFIPVILALLRSLPRQTRRESIFRTPLRPDLPALALAVPQRPLRIYMPHLSLSFKLVSMHGGWLGAAGPDAHAACGLYIPYGTVRGAAVRE
jgi:hypothetical protein